MIASSNLFCGIAMIFPNLKVQMRETGKSLCLREKDPMINGDRIFSKKNDVNLRQN